MTRKDYRLLAESIRKTRSELMDNRKCAFTDEAGPAAERNFFYDLFTDTLLRHLIPELRRESPKFSTMMFRKACGLDYSEPRPDRRAA